MLRRVGLEEAPPDQNILQGALAIPRGGMRVHVARDHRGPIPEGPLAALLQNDIGDLRMRIMRVGISVIMRQVRVEEQDLYTAQLERRPSDGARRVLVACDGLPAAASVLIGHLARVVQDRILEVGAWHNLVTSGLCQLVLVLALLRANDRRTDRLNQATKAPDATILVALVLRVVAHDHESASLANRCAWCRSAASATP
mmetsp:Transcript_103250/g.321753  ORF Transcript_103250/g.321753 Transcript_103250/m.321753 type:complete len:200 (+) Transcript_103250:158-757(+)